MNFKLFPFLILMLLMVVCICRQKNKTVIITAHRGASGLAPENTMAAIVKAMEIGADFTELDVQESADGMLILMHDDSLQRTTGLEAGVWEKSFTELHNLDAGGWFSEEFKGEPIPTLKAIIDTVRDKMKLNIELKMNGHQKLLTDKVVAMVEEENFIQQCILTSFDFAEVDKIRKLNKSIKIGYIFSDLPEGVDVFTADVDLLSVNKKLVNEEFVKKAHAHQKELHVWTVNEPKAMRHFIKIGVDNIITNYPDILKQILAEK